MALPKIRKIFSHTIKALAPIREKQLQNDAIYNALSELTKTLRRAKSEHLHLKRKIVKKDLTDSEKKRWQEISKKAY